MGFFGLFESSREKKPRSLMNEEGIHEVVNVRNLTDQCYELEIKKKNLEYSAGQFFNIGLVGDCVNREFSVYSGIQEDTIKFLIKVVDDGVVSPKLKELKPGDLCEVTGPYGSFYMTQDVEKFKFSLICTGTGISPFHSFVKTYPNLDYEVIHGIRQTNEMYDREDYAEDRYTACVSRDPDYVGYKGRVTDFIKQRDIDTDRIYYLCGNNSMINEMFEILTSAGVNGSNICTEVFF